ncbi:hypothetical protein ABK040_002641 [Willaertia magna]
MALKPFEKYIGSLLLKKNATATEEEEKKEDEVIVIHKNNIHKSSSDSCLINNNNNPKRKESKKTTNKFTNQERLQTTPTTKQLNNLTGLNNSSGGEEEYISIFTSKLEQLNVIIQTVNISINQIGTKQDNFKLREDVNYLIKITEEQIKDINNLINDIKNNLLIDNLQLNKLISDFNRLIDLQKECKIKFKKLQKTFILKNNDLENNLNNDKVEQNKIAMEEEEYKRDAFNQQLLLQQENNFFPFKVININEKEEELQELQKLHKNLYTLHEISKDLNDQVQQQEITTKTIQDNLEKSEINCQKGTKYLQEAKRIGTIGAIMIGSTVGGLIIGGPIGGIVGWKAGMALGTAAGLGGFVAGAVSGGVVAKKTSELGDEVSGANSEITTMKRKNSM